MHDGSPEELSGDRQPSKSGPNLIERHKQQLYPTKKNRMNKPQLTSTYFD